MSFAEIKQSLTGLTNEERLELAGLIAHLNRVDDPEWQQELDKRIEGFNSGNKHREPELLRLHKDLSKRHK